jgi:hypothetical protein
MRFWIVFIAVISFIFAPCLSVAVPHAVYTGFAEPETSYTIDSVEINFSSLGDVKTLSISVSDTAVYRYAYVSADGQLWQKADLSGNLFGGLWLTGNASAQLSFTPGNFSLGEASLSTDRNFVVVYTCSRSRNAWDCHDGWQILQFSANLKDSGQCQSPNGEECAPSGRGTAESGLLPGVPLIHDQTFFIPESAVEGDTVGELNLMWINKSSQSVSFSVVDGDGGRFGVSQSGVISVSSPSFDYSVRRVHALRVRATEAGSGKYSDAVITVNIGDDSRTMYVNPYCQTDEGCCGQGTRQCPVQSWKTSSSDTSGASTSITTGTGFAYLQKRGTIYRSTFYVRASGTSDAHTVIGAYGAGKRPEMDCTSLREEQGIFLGRDYSHDGSGAVHYVDLYSLIVHGCYGIRTSYGNTNLTMRDIEVYDNTDNGGIYIWNDKHDPWPLNQNARRQDILLEDISTHDNNRAAVHGIKIHPGGFTMRNILTYNNGGHGISTGARYADISYVIAYGNSYTDGGGAGIEVGSAHTNLIHVLSYDNYYGVLVNEVSENVNVDDVVAYDNYEGGVAVYGTYGGTVNNVRSYGNGYGMPIRDNTYDLIVSNCSFHDNSDAGIDTFTYAGFVPREIDFLSNTIYGNGGAGVWLEQGSDMLFRNNTLYGNAAGDFDIESPVTGVSMEGNNFP